MKNSGASPVEEILVFVYGTLMRGRANHQAFFADAQFLGGSIADGFALYDLGRYPGAVMDMSARIKGEVYRVNQRILKRLDMMEDEGSLYNRRCTSVTLNGQIIDKVYIYVYNNDMKRRMPICFEEQPWMPK